MMRSENHELLFSFPFFFVILLQHWSVHTIGSIELTLFCHCVGRVSVSYLLRINHGLWGYYLG